MNVRPLFFLIVFLSLLPILGVFFPRLLAFAPGVAGLLGLGLYRVQHGHFLAMWRDGFVIVALICALAGLSSLWALDGDYALKRTVKIALVLFPSVLLVSVVRALDEEARALFAKCFVIAALVAGAVCVIDLYSDGFFYNQFFERKGDMFNHSWLNRAVLVFSLSALIAGYALYRTGVEGAVKRFGYAGLVLLMVLALAKTDSQSTQVFILLALMMWAFFPVARPKAYWALAGAIALGVVLAPIFVGAAYENLAHYMLEYSWLANAYFGDRLEIWDFVLRKAMESPLYGFGIEATRHIEAFDTQMLYTPHNHVLHPHNFAVQSWIEFGVIGAIGAAGLLVYIVRGLANAGDERYRRFALAMFTAVLFVASVSYGVWQSWWLGLIMLMAAYVMILRPEERKNAA